jgi:hypothetical protein
MAVLSPVSNSTTPLGRGERSAAYASDFDIAPELADGSFGIPANNYYNPFGVDIPLLRRRFVEINDRGLREDVRMWRDESGLVT